MRVFVARLKSDGQTNAKKISHMNKLANVIRDLYIQLFRERLSEKVHATILKGIVGGFEYTILQRNLKEWHEKPWTYVFASC